VALPSNNCADIIKVRKIKGLQWHDVRKKPRENPSILTTTGAYMACPLKARILKPVEVAVAR
jgi:hypothetical protein